MIALLGLRHAIENASRDPVTDEAVIAMLRGEGGSGSQLRALFEDNSLAMLARGGAAAGIGLPTILAAYARARDTALAVNRELDEALAGGW